MTSFRYVPYVACVALDGSPALRSVHTSRVHGPCPRAVNTGREHGSCEPTFSGKYVVAVSTSGGAVAPHVDE